MPDATKGEFYEQERIKRTSKAKFRNDKVGFLLFSEDCILNKASRFIDNFSKIIWVYILKSKDEVLERFKK